MRKILLLLVMVLTTVCWLGVASAALAIAKVSDYFRGLESLRADFVQTVYDDQAKLVQTSSGRMYMQRPGKFSWDYQEPYPQLIVADGSRLWLYDSDLEQVSVKLMDKALSATPLALLSGAAPIEDTFTVGKQTEQGGLQWFELRPKNPEAEFESLWIGFKGDTLATIELADRFGQSTRLSFDNLERNVKIDPAMFVFIPPPGVDVVGDLP